MTVYTIGEALIDFVPNRTGKLGDDIAFLPAVGGAPLNVAAAIAKLEGDSAMLTQVGEDDFGDLIIKTAQNVGVHTQYMLQTDKAKTGLAFVTLSSDGERSFSFYRNPSADMLYSADNIESMHPVAGDFLHFCSVSLASAEMKNAHQAAIDKWRAAGAGISFDINIRLMLWESEEACRKAVHEFIPQANIVKVSDDELEFVTGQTNVDKAIHSLFVGNVKYVLYTRGRHGATIYNKDGILSDQLAKKVKAVDATGAGDAFIGAMLYQIQANSMNVQEDWTAEQAETLLNFAASVGALTTLKRGAINSLPTLEEVNRLMS